MRDYDPTTGRYIQADPLGLVDGASVYGYVAQNPMRYVDPRGMQSGTLPYSPPADGYGLDDFFDDAVRIPRWCVSAGGAFLTFLFYPTNYHVDPCYDNLACVLSEEDACFEKYDAAMKRCSDAYGGCLALAKIGAANKRDCDRALAYCNTIAFQEYQRCRGY